MRTLVVTTEPVPLPGLAATGAGLRAWGLTQGLRSRGFDVTVAMPSEVLAAASASASTPPSAQALSSAGAALFERPHLTDFVRGQHPDVLVMQHWGLMDRLGPVDCPLAIDLAGPHLLERLYWGSARPERDLEDKVAALARADFLTCSGPTQRAYFLGFAIASGHDPAAPGLLPVIPFSVAPDHPHAGPHDPGTFVYSGFLLPWQDPSRGIEALLARLEAQRQGRLIFVGGAHPAGDVSRGRFDAILARLRTSPQAELRPPVPYDALLGLLGQAGIAWDLMARNPERELAFPSRTAIYLATGLPVVTGDYGDLARWVAEYDAGWCIGEGPSDMANLSGPEAPPNLKKDLAIAGTENLEKRPAREGAWNLKSALEDMMGNPANVSAKARNALRLVADRMTWDKTIEPLARWCAAPARRSPSGPPPAEALRSSQVLRRQLEEAESRLGELAGRRLVRLSNFLRRLRGR